jgi:hypothetical protein
VIAWDLVARGVPEIVILNQESSYATSLAEAVEREFLALSTGDPVVHRVRYEDQTDLPLAVNDVLFEPGSNQTPRPASVEVVVLTSNTAEIVDFITIGLTVAPDDDRQIFLADGGADDSVLFPERLGGQVEADEAYRSRLAAIRGTRPQVPASDAAQDFEALYFGVYSEAAANSVYSYYSFDAAWLALLGAMWADANGQPITGEAMGRGIQSVSDPESGPPVVVGYDSIGQVRDAFEQGATVDVQGVSGNLDFDPVTGEVSNPIEVWVVRDPADDSRSIAEDYTCSFDEDSLACD